MPGFLVVGLGNPGSEYTRTRHNIGFRIVERFAAGHGMTFRRTASVKGRAAKGVFGPHPVRLLLPETYMNASGEAVALSLRKWGIEVDHLLIVADDIDLPFGQLRLKARSGPGTHNGLKSVQSSLGTDAYPRLRVGVGAPEGMDLADYVLSPFEQDEEEELPDVVERAVRAIELWIADGLTSAMNSVNKSSSAKPSIGE